MKAIKIMLVLILLTLIFSPALAHSIKIASWNIEHLRDSNNEGPNKRKQEDYDRLVKYITELNADIVALQEVEGPNAAKRIFDPAEYNFFFSRRDDVMLTGFAVRKSINVVWNPDHIDLNVNGGLRNGTDITVSLNGESIRMLSVHLKSGCWDDSITSNKDACKTLLNQLAELEEWIDDAPGVRLKDLKE